MHSKLFMDYLKLAEMYILHWKSGFARVEKKKAFVMTAAQISVNGSLSCIARNVMNLLRTPRKGSGLKFLTLPFQPE